jgi:hypothetical protein
MAKFYLVLWGVFGGIVVEGAAYRKLQRMPTEQRPAWSKGRSYWWWAAFRIICGAFLVLADLQSDVSLTAFAAIQIGASSPAILHTILNAPATPGKSD